MGLLTLIASTSLLSTIPVLLSLLLASFLAHNRYQKGLSSIPGPFLATLSSFWTVWHCYTGQAVNEIQLHKKYNSKLVRLGPNLVSVSDAKAVRTIYGFNQGFKKSRYYTAMSTPDGKGGIFPSIASATDEDVHGKIRRPIAGAFSMTSISGYEPLVGRTFDVFVSELDRRFVQTGQACPFDRWVQMFAFDVVGRVLFNKEFGFLREGTDIDNMMKTNDEVIQHAKTFGHMPFIDELTRIKNPWRKVGARGTVINWTKAQIEKREHDKEEPVEGSPIDMMERFLRAQDKHAEVITEDRLIDYARSMVTAGSDTTAVILRDLIWNLSTNHNARERLLNEIKATLDARPSDVPRDAPLTWKETNNMAYTQACIKETSRHHPSVGQLLPRIVPPGGAHIAGTHLPGGTEVGCNAYVVHFDSAVFGEDVDIWNPERWLESEERSKSMESHLFTFGAGARVCLGKNLALLEIAKFIPELFRRFEIEVSDPARYHDVSGFFVVQRGLDCKVRWREPL